MINTGFLYDLIILVLVAHGANLPVNYVKKTVNTKNMKSFFLTISGFEVFFKVYRYQTLRSLVWIVHLYSLRGDFTDS